MLQGSYNLVSFLTSTVIWKKCENFLFFLHHLSDSVTPVWHPTFLSQKFRICQVSIKVFSSCFVLFLSFFFFYLASFQHVHFLLDGIVQTLFCRKSNPAEAPVKARLLVLEQTYQTVRDTTTTYRAVSINGQFTLNMSWSGARERKWKKVKGDSWCHQKNKRKTDMMTMILQKRLTNGIRLFLMEPNWPKYSLNSSGSKTWKRKMLLLIMECK